MNATTRFRADLLEALDPLLREVGFSRRKDSFAWVRQLSSELTHSVHLNFGLYPAAGRVSVNPTLGVRFATVEAALVAAGVVPQAGSRERSTVAFVMRPRDATAYEFAAVSSPAAAANVLWSDLESGELARLEEAGTLDHVIAMLSRPEPDQWGILGRSARARLLPLALRAAGREADALAVLAELEGEMRGVDQMVPPFEHFAAWFRGRAP